MITFQKLKIKNFLSIGNRPLEIGLDEPGVNLITGGNGTGKSAVISSLYYALFGKSFKTLSILDLINFSNKKNMLVVLDFSVDGTAYQIKRGLKPNVFEISRDGKALDYVSKAESQGYLNEQVLKMDSKTFKQLCVICSSSYVPFLKLTAAERRTVVDDILGFNVFTEMLEVLKRKIALNLQEIGASETELSEIKNEFNLAQEKQMTLSETIQAYLEQDLRRFESHKGQLPGLLREIDAIGKEADNLNSSEITGKLGELNSQLKVSSDSMLSETLRRNETLKKKNFFADLKVCPTCTQDISEKTSERIISQLLQEISERETRISEHEAKNGEILGKISALNSDMATINEKRAEYNNKKKKLLDLKQEMIILEKNIEKYREDIQKSQKQQKSVVSEIKAKMAEKGSEIGALEKKKREFEYISALLKDDGIKKVITRNYLPLINSIIKTYLSILELNYSFMFDENFSPVIKMYGKDPCEYNSLSEGEMARLNFILLFVFREFSKIRSSLVTNLLFIDEVGDSTLDSSGIHCLNSILSMQKGTSIFIISHYPENYMSITEKTYTFSKQNMFTSIQASQND
jgi:DNA repair exonuclease SbcCD ATPase subunit